MVTTTNLNISKISIPVPSKYDSESINKNFTVHYLEYRQAGEFKEPEDSTRNSLCKTIWGSRYFDNVEEMLGHELSKKETRNLVLYIKVGNETKLVYDKKKRIGVGKSKQTLI